jgi:hypothetical protein
LGRSLGADVVVDYTQEDVTQGDHRFDLVLDRLADALEHMGGGHPEGRSS